MLSFHHIHLKSADPQATAAWYIDMFDAEQELQMGAMFVLRLPGLDAQLAISDEDDLAAASSDRRCGLEHFAFTTDDLDALLAKGLDLLEPIQERDPDRMQEAMGEPVQRIAFVRAPDQVRIELVELRT